MIPVLYENTETAFTSNGLGGLPDAISCTVTEERNGPYELVMQYPITGLHFTELKNTRYIYAVPADGKDPQPFEIYKISKPLNGVCTIYAEHISYQLNRIPVMPFKVSSCTAALRGLTTHTAQSSPFSTWTDKTAYGTFTLATPKPFREILGGSQGSILDVYGKGEYEFDKFLVRLWTNRGVDTGVTIRYGKNLTELVQDESIATTITGVCPYWYNAETSTLVTLPEYAVWADTADNYPYKRTAVVDFTSDWEEAPTVEQLRARAVRYLRDNDVGVPKINLKISFAPIWQAEGASVGHPETSIQIPNGTVNGETLTITSGARVSGDTLYLDDASITATLEEFKTLERVNLCDTISIVYNALCVRAKAKVVKTVYNVLTDRYDSIEVGNATTNLAKTIVDQNVALSNTISTQASTLRQFVNEQTKLITGGLGGYVVFNYNAEGQPNELLIMDSPDMTSAVNVIRFNNAGIGFSRNGYNGPFTSAWTIDGVFNADFIGAGTIYANLIKAGVLSDKYGRNSWDMDSGELTTTSGKIGPFSIDRNGLYSSYAGTVNQITTNGMSVSMRKRNVQVVGDSLRMGYLPEGGTSYEDVVTLTLDNVNTPPQYINFYLDGERSANWAFPNSTGSNPNTLSLYSNVRVTGNYATTVQDLRCWGNLTVDGTKNRTVRTSDYGDRLLYAYETAAPYFGDIGEGVIDDDGLCYIAIDSVFLETVNATSYQVFLQPYGDGKCFVRERGNGYFVVQGEPGLAFGWEMKAKQKDYENYRLDREDIRDQYTQPGQVKETEG